jgi:hypothetical protein
MDHYPLPNNCRSLKRHRYHITIDTEPLFSNILLLSTKLLLYSSSTNSLVGWTHLLLNPKTWWIQVLVKHYLLVTSFRRLNIGRFVNSRLLFDRGFTAQSQFDQGRLIGDCAAAEKNRMLFHTNFHLPLLLPQLAVPIFIQPHCLLCLLTSWFLP